MMAFVTYERMMPMQTDFSTLIPVILCGGSGSRLWPESTPERPKQMLSLFDIRTMLQITMLRADAMGVTDILIVTTATLADVTRMHIDGLSLTATVHVLAEPCGRNSCAAICRAARWTQDRFGENRILWIMPSDHYIGDEVGLKHAVAQAVETAKTGWLVTFGIRPSRPETGYGYIETGAIAAGAYNVLRFIEKPSLEMARALIQNPAFLWNSGMLIFLASVVLQEIKQHAPQIALHAGSDDPVIYGKIPALSIDKAVLEQSTRIKCVSCDPAWSDIGSWDSLWELLAGGPQDNVASDNAILSSSSGCLVRSDGRRLIGCAGLTDLIIIDHPTGLLVARRGDPVSLQALLEQLQRRIAETTSASQPAISVNPPNGVA